MKLVNMYKVLATTAILGQTMVAPILSHADTSVTKSEIQTMKKSNDTDNKFGKLDLINFISDSKVEDYGNKSKEEAKKGIEGKLKEQEKKLSSEENSVIKGLKNIASINDDLLKTSEKGTDPDRQKEIDRLDGILRKLRTDNTIKVYQSLTGMTEEQATNLKKTIEVAPNYGITSLTKPSGSDPLLEITVPKGSHAAYVTGENHSSELIIERGAGLEFTEKPTKVLDGNHYRIKIKARLLSSEEMREINDNKNKYTDALNKQLGVHEQLIQFDTKKKDSEDLYKEAEKMTTNIGKIDSIILEKLTEKGIRIKLVDYPITESNEYKDLKGVIPRGWEGIKDNTGKQLTWDDVPGVGSTEGRPVIVRIGYSETGAGHMASNLELHEIAHAIDRAVFGNISHTDWFKVPFEAEQKSFLPREYFSNTEEYFAECFAWYYGDADFRQKLKDGAPQTYSYIESLIDTIRKNPNYFDQK
ncbi:hypothetical protein IIU_06732 [Bacillus cereus VD133]|uniref:ATLF-like domain-containing protein n=1 Tax=Bacillus cereus VD133 TaxID=1053233 RepID=A0A9W5PJQ0_BACCE|nr:ADP-ribosyltransferase [Bacillus cereus]EOO24396.1 hypothetical protein IIU_06732 [Bacillus cereus VD133]